MPLLDIQRAFKDALTSEDTHLKAYLAKSVNLGADDQIAIYKNTTQLTLEHCVTDIYPACKGLVGEATFNKILANFAIDHPNQDRDITFYGQHFPEFLGACDPCKNNNNTDHSYPPTYVYDLACLEWAMYYAYYAKNAPAWPQQAFISASSQSVENITLHLADSVQLLKSQWPVHQQVSKEITSPHSAAEKIEEKPYFYIVYRKNYSGVVECLEAPVWQLLSDIHNQKCLAKIIMDNAETCEAWLPTFIQKQWLVNFSVGSAA